MSGPPPTPSDVAAIATGLLRAKRLGVRVWLKLAPGGWYRVHAQARRGRRLIGKSRWRSAPISEIGRLPELLHRVLDLFDSEVAA